MVKNNKSWLKEVRDMMNNFKNIYQIKITLEGIYPRIWRRIQTSSNITLDNFHKILQIVMGWKDYHDYEFMMGGTDYGIPDEEDDDDIGDMVDSRTVKLYQMAQRIINATARGEKVYFVYSYNSRDRWDHEIIIEKYLPIKEGNHYPICLTGKRACPPEDARGLWEYAQILKIIKDPSHPEYNAMLDRIGSDFNPDALNLEEINWRLRRAY